jgi:hypothetical protein
MRLQQEPACFHAQLLDVDDGLGIRIGVGIQSDECITSAHRVSDLTCGSEACCSHERERLIAGLSLIGIDRTQIDAITLRKGEVGNVVGAIADRRRICSASEDKSVRTCSTKGAIAACASVDCISSLISIEDIGSCASGQEVVSEIPVHEVIPAPAMDRVVIITARDKILTRLSVNEVSAGLTNEEIITIASKQAIIAGISGGVIIP